MTEIALLEQKDLRQQAIERIEILDRVKELFLIPQINVMTVKQVAEYYETTYDVVRLTYSHYKKEIDDDGVQIRSLGDFVSNVHFCTLEKQKGKCIIQCGENMILEIPNRGIRVFPKRAILRFGMLLRDSKIAKEVRTQLLNTFEYTTDEQKVWDINEETNILLNLAKALTTGTKEDYVYASKDYFDFQNRHIATLEDSNSELAANNKALAGSILKWEERACLNSAIRLIASKLCTNFAFVWGDLYKELRYKHGIGLTQRGKSPYIQHIKEDEWPLVQQSLAAICEENGISVSKITARAKMKA